MIVSNLCCEEDKTNLVKLEGTGHVALALNDQERLRVRVSYYYQSKVFRIALIHGMMMSYRKR